MEKQWQTLFWGGSKINAGGDYSHEIKRRLLLRKIVMTNLDSILKSRDITLPTKSIYSKLCFSSNHVQISKLDHKESWVLKNWCFWTVMLEKTLESFLNWKEIQSFNPKGNQSWIFIGRTHAEAETPVFWPPDSKNWLIGKDPDAEKDWRWEEKGTTGDEMAGWTLWTWVWVGSGSWSWTRNPVILQSMESQRGRHDLVTELYHRFSGLCQIYYNYTIIHYAMIFLSFFFSILYC